MRGLFDPAPAALAVSPRTRPAGTRAGSRSSGATAPRLAGAFPVSARSLSFTDRRRPDSAPPSRHAASVSLNRRSAISGGIGVLARASGPRCHMLSRKKMRGAQWPKLGLHFVGIAEQKIRRRPLGAQMAFRTIAIEPGVRGGHRGLESVAAGRVGILDARGASGRHPGSVEAAPGAGCCTQAGRASPASGARGGMPGRRNRRTCRASPSRASSSIAFRAAAKSSSTTTLAVPSRSPQRNSMRSSALPSAPRACKRPRSGVSNATRWRRAHSRRCASRSRSRSGGWPSISRRSIAPRDTEVPADEQSAFQRYAALGRGRRRRAAEFDALAAVHCRRGLDLASASVGPACSAESLRSLEQRIVEALHIRFGDEIGEADDKTCHVVSFADAPDFQRRTRQQRIERGGDMRKLRRHREERSRMTPAPRPATGCDSEDRDCRARARPAIAVAYGLRHPGRDLVAIRRVGAVELLLAGEPVLEQRREQSGATRHGRLVVAAASVFPEQLLHREPVGAQRRIVDGVRHIDAAVDRNAMEILALRREQRRHARIRIRLVPDGAGKYRRGILVAGDAQASGWRRRPEECRRAR